MGLASTSVAFASILTDGSSSLILSKSNSHRHHHFVSASASPPQILKSKIYKLNHQRSSSSWIKKPASRLHCTQVEVEADINDEACELVNGVDISIGEGDDAIRACLFTAVKNNNETGILLLSDIFGFEDSATKDFAYRIACNGYNVLVPDLFCGDPWAKDCPKTTFEEWLSKQEPNRLSQDISASTKWLVDEFLAAGISKKLGIIGFCFGGGLVIQTLAKDDENCFGTGVSFYGTRMDSSLAANIKVPVLFIVGDKDPLCSIDVVKEIENGIGNGSKVVVFEGRGHGFAHRPESVDEDIDAEQAFLVLRNWFSDGLVLNK